MTSHDLQSTLVTDVGSSNTRLNDKKHKYPREPNRPGKHEFK